MDDPATDAEPTDGDEGDAPDPRRKRRETIRALLARDSAEEWLALKGGSLAVEAARLRESESDEEDLLPTKRVPKAKEPEEPKAAKAEPESPRKEANDRDAVKAALLDAWTEARKKMDNARTKRLAHQRAARQAKPEAEGAANSAPSAEERETTPSVSADSGEADPKEVTHTEGRSDFASVASDADDSVSSREHTPSSDPTKADDTSPAAVAQGKTHTKAIPRAATPTAIPRAARPETPGPASVPLPGPSVRVLGLMALLVGLVLYLGVSKSSLQSDMSTQVSAVEGERDAALKEAITAREEAKTKAMAADEQIETLRGELRAETQRRAADVLEVKKRQEALDRLEVALETAERDLELASEAAKAAEKRAKAELQGERGAAAVMAERRRREHEEALVKVRGEVKRLEELLRRELVRAKTHEDALTLAGEREAKARTTLEQATARLGALERRVAEQEHTLSQRPTGAPRIFPIEVLRLNPDGTLEQTDAPAVVQGGGAEGVRVSLSLSDAVQAQLQRAARGEVLLSIHVLVKDQAAFPLVLSDGAVSLEGHPGEGLVRFWVHAAQAKALLTGRLRLTLSAPKAAEQQAAVLLRGARVVATPLSDDLRARLDQVERQ